VNAILEQLDQRTQELEKNRVRSMQLGNLNMKNDMLEKQLSQEQKRYKAEVEA